MTALAVVSSQYLVVAVGAPDLSQRASLASAGPSAARTQDTAFGGAKGKSEDAAARSVPAAASGVRGRGEGAPKNICRKPQHAIADFTAQNGKVSDTTPLIANDCGKGKGKKKGSAHH
jgi:hypothetical protein